MPGALTGAPRAATGRRRRREDRSIFGVPERFMRPRLVLVATVAILVAFGVLMVYSASSVTALSSTGDAAYYLKRQLGFAAAGAAVAAALAVVDYHVWIRQFLMPVWGVSVVLLALVVFVGTDNDMGATRWLDLGFFDLQPSEFAKITVIFTAASLAERYYEEGSLDWYTFLKLLVAGVGVPIVLIVVQPDKGTTMVLALTLLVMGYLAGMPKAFLAGLAAVGIVAFLALSLKDSYSRQRLFAMLDPWADPYDTGYQLIQGFYAFGSGGLFGVGIGFSRQKYSYLPMAHNDFILAVIGEECGLVGTLGLLAGFAVFLWAGFRIARYAPDLAGRLVAAGCTSLVVIQLLLNVFGVLGMFPLSGKPIPFVSYGGSSILASMMLVGFIVSVSVHSRLPETAHDGARRSLRVQREEGGPGLSLVGEPVPRSQRHDDGAGGAAGERGRGFTVVEGGASRPRAVGGRSRGREPADAPGGRRIDLGPSAADRLRGSGGPRTRR